MSGVSTNGLTALTFLTATGSELTQVDTQLPNGISPQQAAVALADIRKFEIAPLALLDAATITPDLSASSMFSVTLAGNRTLANPANLNAGRTWRVVVTQDGTGSRTLTYGALYKWAAGTAPTLSTGAGKIDVLTFTYDGTRIIGSSILDVR